MGRTVQMHFGDGSYKDIEMTADDPEEAVEEAKTWVNDNAWFEVSDEDGNELARVALS